jgi:hypothetical protein
MGFPHDGHAGAGICAGSATTGFDDDFDSYDNVPIASVAGDWSDGVGGITDDVLWRATRRAEERGIRIT